MERRESFRLLTVSLALLAAVAASWAQVATGRLAGVVRDETDLPIPAVSVVVRSERTTAETRLETNSSGGFSAIALPPGTYAIEVEADGFQKQIVTGVKVDVASETSVPPIVLAVGAVTEVVEVVAGVSQVQTTNAELTATVTTEQIDDLPLLNRDPFTLIALQAGVSSSGGLPTVINGQRTSFSNVTLDGISIQDNYIRTNALDFLPNRTSLDQVSEFTITTQNAGSAAGGGSSQVSFTTRSGGPEFHGNGYWHNRNDNLGAAGWFSNRQGLPKPFLNQNQIGGSLGGPLIENRLFFYVNYEVFRERADRHINAPILTEEASRGIFSYVDDDDILRKVNVLRMVDLPPDATARRIYSRVPGPDRINNFDIGDSSADRLLNTAGYRFLTGDDQDRDALTSRFDYNLTDRDVLTLTYKTSGESGLRADTEVPFTGDTPIEDHVDTNLLSLAWRTAPGPRWTNELRGGFNLTSSEFTNSFDRDNVLLTGFLFGNPDINFDPQGRDTDTFNLMNDTAHQRGNHNVRFGAWSQMVRVNSFNFGGTRPTFIVGIDQGSQYALSFNQFPGGITGAALNDAESLLASLAGIVAQGSQVFNINDRAEGFVRGEAERRGYRYDTYAFYLQDQWKLRPRLTLNLGLRWEYQSRLDEKNGLMLSPVETAGGIIETLLSNAELDFAGSAVGRPLWSPDRNNFAPNVGVAWDVFGDGSTALRAGYSINYVNDDLIGAAQNAVTANQGLQAQPIARNLDLFLSGPLTEFATPELQVPRRASDNLAIDDTAALFAPDPRLRAPYVQQWNVGVQRDIGFDTVIEARYVGNKGTKLLRGFDYNQLIIRENGFLEDFLRARGNGFLALEAEGEFDPEFNPAIIGSQPLTFFPQLDQRGLLADPTIQDFIKSGEPGTLAELYYLNDFTQDTAVGFRRNPNTFPADLLTNYSNSSYNSLQLELRRRAATGLQYQANYTFSKVLTDSSGGSQVRFDPFLDINRPEVERARADYDLSHVFNANFVYELPFGPGKRWAGPSGLDKLVGGWTVSSIVNWQSGLPFSVLSGRGTVNRLGRSGENTADTALTKSELDSIVDFRMTGDGPFMIAASAINPRDNSGVSDDGDPAFDGQVFSHPEPGEVGALQRRLFSGPSVFSFDLGLSKSTALTERQALLFGARVQNFLNTPTFRTGSHSIGSEQFGRITSTATGSREVELYLRYSF